MSSGRRREVVVGAALDANVNIQLQTYECSVPASKLWVQWRIECLIFWNDLYYNGTAFGRATRSDCQLSLPQRILSARQLKQEVWPPSSR